MWAVRLQTEDRATACRCLANKPPGAQVSLTHMSSCKYGGGAIKRHDTVLLQVNEMLRAAGIKTHLEPRARDDLRPTYGKVAPDILADDAGRHFFVEVMVKDQSQPSLLSVQGVPYTPSGCRARRGPEAGKVQRATLEGPRSLRGEDELRHINTGSAALGRSD